MIVWLASYPKSGNTWMRVLLTNYGRDGDEPAHINRLDDGGIASARICFDEWVGIEASSLPEHLVRRLRRDVYRCLLTVVDDTIAMKVHDAWGRADDGEPIFPADVTHGVVYVVRDPLDIAPSFAHHMHVDLATTVDRMCAADFNMSDQSGNQLVQQIGTWADHVVSWLDESELPVEVVRYEDLHADPVGTLRRVVRFFGLEDDEDRAARAVAHSAFEVLRAQEDEGGFRERAPHAESFFRRGEVGDGGVTLSPALRSRLGAVLGSTMTRLGYARPEFDHEAFGLVWRTPFFCAGLRPAPGTGRPDVTIELAAVPTKLEAAVLTERRWEAAPGRYLFRGRRDVGRFLVEGGAITFHPANAYDDVRAARVFTDRILYAALQQRGFLVLHANAAAIDGSAVAIAGDSGAGKSTTLAALLDRGAQMLCDDVCALALDDKGHVIVFPGVAQMHLTKESAVGLGLNFDAYSVQPWRRMKAAVPTGVAITASATPLRSITILSVNDGEEVAARELTGQEKFNAVLGCMYGPVFPQDQPIVFPMLSAIVRDVSVRDVTRPDRTWSVDAVIAHVVQ